MGEVDVISALKLNTVFGMASDALANNDPDFALTICRNAMALVAHPKLMVFAGEANEAKGDTLSAVACYRAALTIDPARLNAAQVEPSVLTETTARATKLLAAASKKLGLEERWSRVDKKEQPITAARIEQLLKMGSMDQALLQYRRSPQFKEAKDSAFHLQVGRAFRAHKLRAEATEALALATRCDENGAIMASYEIGDLHYEAHEYEDGLEWYARALAAVDAAQERTGRCVPVPLCHIIQNARAFVSYDVKQCRPTPTQSS
jgi:tetratricopeptide (TPR) repeat protein